MKSGCVRRSHGRVDDVDVEGDVDWVVTNSLPDGLDDASPANLLDVFRVRDDESDIAVVLLVIPPVQSVADADMLAKKWSG